MGRFTVLLQDGSATILAVVKDAKGRRRKIVIASVLAVLLIAVGGFAVFRMLTAQAAERVVSSYHGLTRCLLGELPAEGSRPSMRLRALQLSALTGSDLKRAEGKGEPWPERCASPAHAFHEALVDAGRAEAGHKDLAHWVEQLATQLKEKTAYGADLSEPVDQIWSLAAKEGLNASAPPTEPADVPAPPSAARPLTLDQLGQTTQITQEAFELKSLRPEQHPGRALRFLVEDKDLASSPFVCTLADEAEAAHCKKLHATMAGASHAGFHLLGTTDANAAPLIFAGPRGEEGVFRSDSGERLAEAGAIGGHVAADGFAAVLAWNAARQGLQLIRASAEQTRPTPLMPSSFRLRTEQLERDAQLLWNTALLRGKNAFDETWLAAAPVLSELRALGDVQNVGRLPDLPDNAPAAPPPQLTGCRTSEGLVLRIRHGAAEYLSFGVDGRWTKPVQVPSPGGTLSCRKTEAAITRIDRGSSDEPLQTAITHHRCTPASCQSHTTTVKQLLTGEQGLAPSALLAATGLGGKLLVVWGAGSRGGLRMRLAPARRIAKADDVILFDDLVKDGQVQKTSTLFDLRLLSREGFATLLLSTATGLRALRIKPDGSFAAVDAQWDP